MRDNRDRQRHRQREKQAPCREPDVGFDPGFPGSHLGTESEAKPLSHPGCPHLSFKALLGNVEKSALVDWVHVVRTGREKQARARSGPLQTPGLPSMPTP